MAPKKWERIGFKQWTFWLTLFCNNPIFWVTSFSLALTNDDPNWPHLVNLFAPEESLPKFMEFFTRKLQATGAFFCGDKATIADLQILAQLRYFTKGVADHVPADSWRWTDDVFSTRNGKSTGNICSILNAQNRSLSKDCLSPFPVIMDWMKKMYQIPQIKAWYKLGDGGYWGGFTQQDRLVKLENTRSRVAVWRGDEVSVGCQNSAPNCFALTDPPEHLWKPRRGKSVSGSLAQSVFSHGFREETSCFGLWWGSLWSTVTIYFCIDIIKLTDSDSAIACLHIPNRLSFVKLVDGTWLGKPGKGNVVT